MQLPSLLSGTLIKRYKRFLADIKLDSTGEIVTAHCPNSGSMLNLRQEGLAVYVSQNTNPKNKLKYKLELVKDSNDILVDVNTMRTNQLVKEGLLQQKITEFTQYNNILTEVKELSSRFDFKLSNQQESCFVEVKSVTLLRNSNLAEFPDAITTRGTKHLHDLIQIQQSGTKTALLYIIQRNEDFHTFAIAKDIDKEYYKVFTLAKQYGVQFICYNCKISTTEIIINHKVEFEDAK